MAQLARLARLGQLAQVEQVGQLAQLDQLVQLVKNKLMTKLMMETDIGLIKLVVIQPTPFCNLDCDYCYLPDRHLKARLSLDLLDPIFKNLFQSNLIDREFTVVWHAGEPLTMPIKFYEKAFQKINQLNQNLNNNHCQISHSFQTNGTLINQAWCDLINKYQVRVGVSLDGPAFIHDIHRKTRKGLGTHASTMRGISLLKANKINFHVIAVLTQDSLNFPEEIFNFFLEHQIRRVGFNIEEKEGAHLNRLAKLINSRKLTKIFKQESICVGVPVNTSLSVEVEHLPINILKMVPLLLQKQCIVDTILRCLQILF